MRVKQWVATQIAGLAEIAQEPPRALRTAGMARPTPAARLTWTVTAILPAARVSRMGHLIRLETSHPRMIIRRIVLTGVGFSTMLSHSCPRFLSLQPWA